jgi:glycerate 2-kinase
VKALALGDSFEGEARELAAFHAAIVTQIERHGEPVPPPCVLLSGGEAAVTVRGDGRGGRNTEFLLALGLALECRLGSGGGPASPSLARSGGARVWALACDTDGIDGTEDNAGAMLTPDSLARARALGLDPRARLEDNDAYGFFAALGGLVLTGPTRTNVNDLRVIFVSDPTSPAGRLG